MNPAISGFEILQPGILSLIQDSGRIGYQQYGLTNGGPVDAAAFNWANRLCNNQPGTTAIEVNIGGLMLRARVRTQIAITGAAMSLSINGKLMPIWQSHNIYPKDIIRLGYSTAGSRCYLATAGGFTVEPQFASTSTVVRERIGGLNGESLLTGDIVPCPPCENSQRWRVLNQYRPRYTNHINLRAIPSYQHKLFTRAEKRKFYRSTFTVSRNCDRMGYRLNGTHIKSPNKGILSEGIVLGAIQIPHDGNPIIMLQDRPTMGGYPKIATVLSLDIAALGQLKAGDTVSFSPISVSSAKSLVAAQRERMNSAKLQAIGLKAEPRKSN